MIKISAEIPMTFSDLKITRQFINAIEDAGFERPLPIQEKAIPAILSGQDVIGIAQTGTGKTLAYALPLLQKVKYAKEDVPRGLILVPTRELVIQVLDEMIKLAKYTDIRCVGLMGGKAKTEQIESIKKGVDIVVATPGRLMELYLLGELQLKLISTLVLDEADRMMDMGFLPQLKDLLEVIPVKRQNLLFSATFSKNVEELSHDFLEFPLRIEIAPQASTAEHVKQELYELPNFKSKLFFLEQLLELNEQDFSRVIIFCRTKKRADAVYNYVQRKIDRNARVIHSNKSQTSRSNAFKLFKSGELRFLITTDISARGIDVNEVSHVVNFDIPVKSEDYTHRIGRTGRVYKVGHAISLANPAEMYSVNSIEQLINEEIERMTLPKDFAAAEYLPGEKKQIAMTVDHHKRLLDPSFKGAFHKRKGK